MANIKISSLEETKISNPDASFVMVVAKDDASNLYKNYRISLSELRNIIGSIEGDIVTGITEEQVRSIVANAIEEDNANELTQSQVIQLIKTYTPTQSLNETRVNELIDAAITADNITDLQETRVQEMIDASITADNLKNTVAEVVPDVIPEFLPEVIPDILPETTIEVTNDILETPTTVKVVEVAEKAIINEIEITKIKEVTEDCVCEKHADECFNEIFK